jgi:UDPglucose--hexose-1-phosphate uridylyltransferase
MAELRYNPLIKDWVMIAAHRQDRPQMPAGWCPFCPGSGKVPDHYQVHQYDNDFPALSAEPPPPDDVATKFFQVAASYGKCEVILYSSQHDALLYQLPDSHLRKLVDLWVERFCAMRRDEQIKFVFIFENRGDVVGVTMPHPHGQIYGYPFIPKRIELELAACREHFQVNGSCLICDLVEAEIKQECRMIFANDDFYAYLPFFSEYPYGLHIASKRHVAAIDAFNDRERDNLGRIIKEAVGTLDNLFDRPFPYMMCMYQTPVNSEDTSDYYHFHIKFYSPVRSEHKLKYNASSETGAWAHCNPTTPEEKAAELQSAHNKYKGGIIYDNAEKI